jgi:membrane-associated protease RseP (regulator of RpoE activity)
VCGRLTPLLEAKQEAGSVPSGLLYAIGVLIFIVGLLISIALHEVGHMVPAKKFGVKVTQYMVGFGRTVWSRKSGDTEYGIKAIPLGGYIRMIGMVPPRNEGKPSRWPQRMSTAIEDFRQTSRSEVGPGDEDRQFYRLTPGKKIIVMVGGPTMNLLIFLVLSFVLLSMLGQAHNDATTRVQSISQCVVAVTAPEAKQTDCSGLPSSPALAAHLKPGDTITAVNGVAMSSWDQIVSAVEASPGKPMTFTVSRDGKPVTLTVVPVENTKCANDACTLTKKAGFIGVAPLFHHYYRAVPIAAVPGQIVSELHMSVDRLASYPSRVGNLFGTIFENKPRDPAGAIGVVGIGRLSGDFASSKAYDLQDKIALLVGLLASVNLMLFFFNMLPLLPLDGGHVAGALVESVKRGRARLAHKDGAARQIYVDTAQMLPVIYGVGSLLVVLTLLTLYADIVKPISLNGG